MAKVEARAIRLNQAAVYNQVAQEEFLAKNTRDSGDVLHGLQPFECT